MICTRLLLPFLCLGWIGMAWSTDSNSVAQKPVPDQGAVEEARRLVHDAFESDLLNAASNPEPLIEKLVTASGQTEDPARSYALLLEAEQAAVAAGKPDRVMELVAIRSREFTIDPIQARVALLEELFTAQARRDQSTLVSLFGHAAETARLGIERESLEQAASAAELSGSAAKALYLLGKAKKVDSLAKDGENKQRQARELREQIAERAELLAEFVKAQSVLKDSPEDPGANETVGSYLCFYRNEWKKGLNALAKGEDKTLAGLAAREAEAMSAAQPDANKLLDLAGAWWRFAEASRENVRPKIITHSAHLYERCRESLQDPVEQSLAANRIAAALNQGMGANHAEETGPGVALLGKTGYARLVQPLDVQASDYFFSCLIPADTVFTENDHVPTLMGRGTSGTWPRVTLSDVRREPQATGWIKYSCSIHTDASGPHQFAIAVWGRERIHFAQVSLKARGSNQELLKNGNFEDGKSSWSTDGGTLVWLKTRKLGAD